MGSLGLATVGQAQDSGLPAYRVDAFGVIPQDRLTEARAAWSDIDRPPAKVADILAFVGQKSLVAGLDIGHGVAILLDRWGNMVADGTTARFTLGTERIDTRTVNGIADVLYMPATIAGTYDAGIASGDIQSPRAMYRVTADLTSIRLEKLTQIGDASLENFVAFSSTTLTDKFGNIAPSGTGGKMTITHGPRQFSFMTPVVANGRQKAFFLIRDIPRTGRLTATLANSKTSPMDFNVVPNTLAGPSRITIWPLPDLRAVHLRIGPVISSAGHLLNDGAKIRVTIQGRSGREVTQQGWLLDGMFDAIVAMAPTDLPFQVSVETALGPERAAVLHLESDQISTNGAQ